LWASTLLTLPRADENLSGERVSGMQRSQDQGFRRSVIRAIPGTFLVGLITAICYALRLDLTVTGFLYLIIVVLQSLIGDFVSSAIVSVIADLCLNFFFALRFSRSA
jgi:K+-sensing histidine kinase KdpD